MSETLKPCPHCGSVAEYASEHARGKRWAVACTMTSKVAADEGKPMCRCRTPFVRDKGQARDIWNRRAAVTDHDFAMAVHDGSWWGRCSECEERRGYHEDAETIRNQQERIAELQAENADALAMLANQAATIKEQMEALRERDELICDMWRCLSAHIESAINDGDCGYPYSPQTRGCGEGCTVNGEDCSMSLIERRMRGLGIEVEDEG